MLDRLAAARLKLKRADKHIADVQQIVLGLPDSYHSMAERDEKTGFQVIQYYPPDTDKLVSEMAVIIGDAIHNLRVAVDYGYLGVIEKRAPSAFDKWTKFPIGETRESVENALRGRKIDVLCPSLFKWILTDVKPYRAGDGNCLITCLHDFDISDKHWLLTPMVQSFHATGIVLEDEQGRESTGNTYQTTVENAGPYHIAFPGNVKVKNKGKLSVTVVFNERNIFKGFSVLDTLRDFSKVVGYLINELSQF